jgi:hypothetical protein
VDLIGCPPRDLKRDDLAQRRAHDVRWLGRTAFMRTSHSAAYSDMLAGPCAACVPAPVIADESLPHLGYAGWGRG